MTAVKQFDSFMERFCTPIGRGARPLACDETLKRHIMDHVQVIAAGGAAKERRAVFLAVREVFKNVRIVIRDPAHAIRIATSRLYKDSVFGEVWHELFGG